MFPGLIILRKRKSKKLTRKSHGNHGCRRPWPLVACGPSTPPPPSCSCLLPSLPLTASGYRSPTPLPLVCWRLFHCAATCCLPVPSPPPLPASPPLVTPLPLVVPLSFGWLLRFPVPQPLLHVALPPGASSASAIHHHHTSTFCHTPLF